MILDNETLFSDRQAVTATAGSANTVDLGPINLGVRRDIGPGTGIPVMIQVVEAFAGLTSLKVGVQVDDNEAFSSPKTVIETAVIALADLKAGYVFSLSHVPIGTNERYMRLMYTVVGTGTGGLITAGVSLSGAQTNG